MFRKLSLVPLMFSRECSLGISLANTVEPRFNEVPRDWGNLFVISRVRYIENSDLTNFLEKKKTKCSLYRGIVND